MDNEKSTAEETPAQTKPTGIKIQTSKIWTAVILFAVILLFLIIFLAENSKEVKISFLGLHGHLSLAVTMLVSALAGAVLVILAGSARILQLRRHANPKNSEKNQK